MASDPTAAIFSTEFAIIAAVSILALGLAYFGYAMYKQRSSSSNQPEKKEFEGDDIDELVGDRLFDLVGTFGQKADMKLVYGLRSLGTVYRRMNMLEEDKDGDLSISDEEKKLLEERGHILEEEKDMLDGSGASPHEILAVRPSSGVKKMVWRVTDDMLGLRLFSKMFVVPTAHVRVSPGDGSVSIDDAVQFRKIGGVYAASTTPTMNVVESCVYESMYEGTLQAHANYHKKVLFFSDDHGMRMHKIEKEAEEKRKRYSSSAANDMKGR